jgi:hypothetical protein
MSHLEGDDDGGDFGVLGQTIRSTNIFGETANTEFGVWGIAAKTSVQIRTMRLELGQLGELIQPLDPDLNVGNQGTVPAAGVFGVSLLGANTAGVAGENDKLGGFGVLGASYQGEGVHGQSIEGPGVVGSSVASDGVQGVSMNGTGVLGRSSTGRGVWGTSENMATVGDSNNGTGVYGHSVHGTGVVGRSDEDGDGVTGWSGNGSGVAGVSSRGNGVYGRSDSDFGKAGYFDGNVTVTGDICLGNADCAEDFDVTDPVNATPGTVMVLDEGGGVSVSQHSYDTRVAGVVSGAGGYRPAIILDRGGAKFDRRPLALLGKVYCKVDAGYGSIHVGDLLTTSETPGHAMRVSDRARAFGAVIGKALEGLTEGTSLIPVLVGLR